MQSAGKEQEEKGTFPDAEFLAAALDLVLKTDSQAWYLTEATEAIASMPPGHCLGALEMLQ